MKKVLLSLLVVMLGCSCAFSAPARIGVLAPIGQDEEGIIKWTEDVAELEGKTLPFRNVNTMVIYDNLSSMIMGLKAGQIDRFAVGLFVAQYITARNDNFELINNNHNAIMGYAIAVREEDKPKLLAVNLAINDMRADGTLARMIQDNIVNLGTEDPKAAELPKFDDAETMKIAITGDLPPMDCILADGTPAGFNTAFLAELAKRTHKNIELVSVSAGARQTAISSGRVDAIFWTRNVYNRQLQLQPHPLDKMVGVAISEPYLLESRAAVSLKKD